ncbi:MAG: 4'-phosphopantetheinyl transferase superfamily protein [Clostridia bacterium]|nr:4'-phosphopantetheinyl transferase superfamily protein [Clostridia bacterium]
MPEHNVQLYFWNAEQSADWPPTEAQVDSFPTSYATRYREAKAESVRQQACGSAFLLAMHLGVTSDEQLERGEHGQLSLTEDSRHICLSHSGPVTVLAVSDDPVGVDLEHVTEERPSIANRFFPESFRQELEDAPAEERTLTFFHLWTRLEAALKADGRGLTAPRPEFEESLERYDIETEQRNDLIWSIATEK